LKRIQQQPFGKPSFSKTAFGGYANITIFTTTLSVLSALGRRLDDSRRHMVVHIAAIAFRRNRICLLHLVGYWLGWLFDKFRLVPFPLDPAEFISVGRRILVLHRHAHVFVPGLSGGPGELLVGTLLHGKRAVALRIEDRRGLHFTFPVNDVDEDALLVPLAGRRNTRDNRGVLRPKWRCNARHDERFIALGGHS